ncbi:MAG: hypothetical protein ABIO94_10125, partial [Opitutaceae bacterium]
ILRCAADERPVCHSERSEESTLSPAFHTWILRSAQNDKRWFDVIAMRTLESSSLVTRNLRQRITAGFRMTIHVEKEGLKTLSILGQEIFLRVLCVGALCSLWQSS